MVLPVIRENRMEKFITGVKSCPLEFIESYIEGGESEMKENPEYEDWIVKNHILLGWIYNSTKAEVVAELVGYETS